MAEFEQNNGNAAEEAVNHVPSSDTDHTVNTTDEGSTKGLSRKEAERLRLTAMSDHELIVEMAQNSKKALIEQRITTFFAAIMLVIVVVAVAVLVPTTKDMVQHVDDLVVQADASLDQIDDTVSDINKMVSENEETINEAIKGLDQAMQAMNQIDLEGLNKSIQNLQKVVSPLAGLFR